MERDADSVVMDEAVCAWKLHSAGRDVDQLPSGGVGVQFPAT